MTVEEFHALLRAQGAASQELLVFKCPMCGTLQSISDLVRVGAGDDAKAVDGIIGFSCIGRFTGAGPFKKGKKPGLGCDWTLGGFLHLHELEVITEDGKAHPHFMPATPEEAAEHWRVKPFTTRRIPTSRKEVAA